MSIPTWKQIEGLSKWLIRKTHPNDDYKEYLGLAYIMYDRCKETFNPEKGNFQSYYRLRLFGELHREMTRQAPVVSNVDPRIIGSLNTIIINEDGWEQEWGDAIEDTSTYVKNYDDLAEEVISILDNMVDIDAVKLAVIKNRIQNEYVLIPRNDVTYESAIELLTMYLKD